MFWDQLCKTTSEMDICIMELLAFLFFVILILLTASETETTNIGVLLYSICVRFLRYILYGQELYLEELEKLVPENNCDSVLQREKMHEITPKETQDNGEHILKTSTLPIQDSSSTKNLLAKDTSTTGLIITSCSTKIYHSYSFLQDVSQETSKDFVKLPQERESSFDSLTKENGKGFDIPVVLTGLSENETQNHFVTEMPVGTQPICAMVGKESDCKTITKSEEVVQFSLDDLRTSVAAISYYSCPVTAGTYDDSLQVGTLQACDIRKKLSIEVGYSSQNTSSKDIPTLIAEDSSENDCTTGNVIKDMEFDENSPVKQSAFSTVPMEFLYPCLPYFNP